MKRILGLFAICFIYFQSTAQCPDTTLTDPGFFPPSDSLDCVERGVPYSAAIQVNIPATIAVPVLGNVTVTSIQFNDVFGEPSGIVNSCTPANCTFAGGTSGCLLFAGTTTDPAGLYPLAFEVTISVDVPFLGPQVFGPARLDSLLAGLPLGIEIPFLSNIVYELKVIEQGNPCIRLRTEITGTAEYCPGDTVTLTADVSNNTGNETYLWSTGATTSTVDVFATGFYSVSVSDQGETVVDTFEVVTGVAPTADFYYHSFGQNAQFFNTSSANARTYSWDFDDGSTSQAENPVHTFAAAGSYDVALTATNGCGSNTSTQTIVASVPPCSLDSSVTGRGVFPGPNAIPCIEREVPYSFTMQTINFDTLFSNAGTAITVNYARIDSVENLPCGITWQSNKLQYAAGERGCILVSGTTKEVVGQYPVRIYMTLGVDIPFLGPQEESGELNAMITELNGLLATAGQPPLNVDYNFVSRVVEAGGSCPPRNTSATANASGDVCPAFTVDIDGSLLLCPGATNTLTAVPKYYTGNASAITYSWSGGQTTDDLSVTTAGTYSVTVTETGGGTATASVTVVNDPCTGIKTVENDLNFSVFPNPGTGMFNLTLSLSSPSEVTMKIVDLNGKVLIKEEFSGAKKEISREIDLTTLPKGIYLLHLKTESSNGIQRLAVY